MPCGNWRLRHSWKSVAMTLVPKLHSRMLRSVKTPAGWSLLTGGASKARGVSSSKDWEIVKIDDKEVPLAINGAMLRPVDKAAVMRLIRATKGSITIPGVTYREVAKMSFSRRG